jgi:hypothetical protein
MNQNSTKQNILAFIRPFQGNIKLFPAYSLLIVVQ